jgi:hypothetical protein
MAFHVNRERGLLSLERKRIHDGGLGNARDIAGACQKAII